MRRKILLFIGVLLYTASCKVDPPVPEDKKGPPVYGINFTVPQGWPQPIYNFAGNPLTEEGFRLGRKLFYDTRLSRDNTISCGSCHQNFAGFAHSAHPLSHGIDGLFGSRNAPGLFNLNWHPSFMWDGSVTHLEIQPLTPITDPVEMDETLDNVIAKLQLDAVYEQLFSDAFGDNAITPQRIFKALAQFQGMLVSANSKYDRYMRGEPGVVFSESEQRGFQLFSEKQCASCHVPPLFTDFSFRNNGLSYNVALKDSGRARTTGLSSDVNKFKVPSLRNVSVSAPYMHDGRFNSLAQCLTHYSQGINQTENLDSGLKNGIPMTIPEMQDIIQFLGTLNDDAFLKDPRFTDPN